MNYFRGLGCALFMLLGITAALPSTAQAAPTAVEKVNMFMGEARVLTDIAVKRVAVGNGKLLSVKILSGRQLLLLAEKAGSTSLHLWLDDGTESDMNIRISKDDPETRIRLEKMIHMDVKIVEFRKTALKTIGIDWQKSIDGPIFASAGDYGTSTLFRGVSAEATPSAAATFGNLPNAVQPFQTYFGIATAITSKINYLASTGDAFMMAEPRLSCRNGGEAKFLAGGQLPIPVRGANGEITVQFKDFGIILNIAPYVDDSGIIAAKIQTEVSSVDLSVNVLGVPGFLTRKTETEMNVRENDTIVISGLINSESSTDVNKVPGISDIPILGKLFSSDNFANRKTELVIFVTPRVFIPEDLRNKQDVERANARTKKRIEQIGQRLTHGIVD